MMNSLAFFLHSPSNTKRQGSRSRKRTENNQGEVMSHPPEQPAEPFQNVFVVCYPQSKAETHSPIHTHTHTHTHLDDHLDDSLADPDVLLMT